MNGKSYDATDYGSEKTRCGNCGRMIRANAPDTEKVSVPLRFLLYPIPIVSYAVMTNMVKRFCCLPCKEEYEARYPKSWKSAFWWFHGLLFGIPAVLIIVCIILVILENGLTVPQ